MEQKEQLRLWRERQNRAIGRRAGTDSSPEDAFQRLLKTLRTTSNTRWKRREAAASLLGDCTSSHDQRYAAIQCLGSLLRQNQEQDLRGAIYRWTIRSCLVSWLITLTFGFRAPEGANPLLRLLVITFLGVPFLTLFMAWPVLPVSALLDRVHYSRVHRAAIQSLARLRRGSCVGPLAASCAGRPRSIRQAAQSALEEVLHHLSDEERAAVPTESTPDLCRALPASGPPLQLGLLNLLEHAGTGAALSAVSRLASVSGDEAVRTACLALVPLLEQRASAERAHETLLRPATASGRTDNLLTPVSTHAPRASPAVTKESLSPSRADETVMVARAPSGESG